MSSSVNNYCFSNSLVQNLISLCKYLILIWRACLWKTASTWNEVFFNIQKSSYFNIQDTEWIFLMVHLLNVKGLNFEGLNVEWPNVKSDTPSNRDPTSKDYAWKIPKVDWYSTSNRTEHRVWMSKDWTSKIPLLHIMISVLNCWSWVVLSWGHFWSSVEPSWVVRSSVIQSSVGEFQDWTSNDQT